MKSIATNLGSNGIEQREIQEWKQQGKKSKKETKTGKTNKRKGHRGERKLINCVKKERNCRVWLPFASISFIISLSGNHLSSKTAKAGDSNFEYDLDKEEQALALHKKFKKTIKTMMPKLVAVSCNHHLLQQNLSTQGRSISKCKRKFLRCK